MGNFKTVTNPELDHDTTEKGGVENPGTRPLEVVKAKIKEWQVTSNKSYLKLGRLLLEFRSLCEYGEWSKWLQDNVDFSVCKAQRLMRVAKWMDGNEAPVPDLDFTKAYILSRLSGEDLKSFLVGKDVEGMKKQKLQEDVCNYLRDKPRKGTSTVKTTTQQQSNVSTEDDLRKRFDKIQTDVSELASLVDTDSGVHDAFAAELCKLCQSIIQRLSPEDIENA